MFKLPSTIEKVFFMAKEQNLAHTKWLCKYHIVFTPNIGENLSMGNTVKRLEEFYDSYAVTKGWRFWKGI